MSRKRERSPELKEFDDLALVILASPTFVFQFGNTWMMCEARSRQEKTKMSRKRERSSELEESDDLALVMRASPTFVFQFHRLCGLPYIAIVWQVAVWHHLY